MRYDARNAAASCARLYASVRLKPISFTEEANAATHAGQSRKNVQSAIDGANPSESPSGMSITIVAATFSLAANPVSAA